jgi:flagellar hook-associated protein 2
MSTTSTTSTPLTISGNSVTGVGSSLPWNQMVDASVKLDTSRMVKPYTDQIARRDQQRAAWLEVKALADTLGRNARALRQAGMGGLTVSAPSSPTTSRPLVSAVTTSSAVTGRSRVEVVQLAEAEKLVGSAVADSAASRGIAGTLTLNGTAVTIAATDSLRDIQGKINALNTGATPSGITATIQGEGGTAGRLVLTRDGGGSAGITVGESGGGVARELGLVDTRSKPISSATLSAAAALGLTTTVQPAQIAVGDKLITVDLAVESITAIAAKINAAGGSAGVDQEAFGSETRHRLVVDGNVSAVAGNADSATIVSALGLAAGDAGVVRQTIQTGVLSASGGGTATASTPLVGLRLDGVSAGLSVGDSINIRGMRGDGTAVSVGLVVQAGDTLQTLLAQINGSPSTNGFLASMRPATAQLGSDGRIRMTDSTGGTSRLALSLGITRADGTTGTLGTAAVAVSGRPREAAAGKDAIIRVDGREIVRTSNTIADAITGVTLTLQNAEPGTSIDVVVDRDVTATTAAVQKLVDSYNALRGYMNDQRVLGGPLGTDGSLRRLVDGFTAALRTKVTTNGTYQQLATVGVALSKDGVLGLDAAAFRTALGSRPTEVEALFGFTGAATALSTAADNVTRFGSGVADAQVKSIDTAKAGLQRKETDAQARVEARRLRMVERFSRMEEALVQLRQQQGTITSLNK